MGNIIGTLYKKEDIKVGGVMEGETKYRGVKRYFKKVKKHKEKNNMETTPSKGKSIDALSRDEMLKVLHNEACKMEFDLFYAADTYATNNFTDPNYGCRLTFTMFELPGKDSPYHITWPCTNPVILCMLEKIFSNIVEMLDLQSDFLSTGLNKIRASMKSSESTLKTHREKITKITTPWKPTKQTTHELNDQANLIPLKVWPVLKNGETDIAKRRKKLVTFALLKDIYKFAITYKNATENLIGHV